MDVAKTLPQGLAGLCLRCGEWLEGSSRTQECNYEQMVMRDDFTVQVEDVDNWIAMNGRIHHEAHLGRVEKPSESQALVQMVVGFRGVGSESCYLGTNSLLQAAQPA